MTDFQLWRKKLGQEKETTACHVSDSFLLGISFTWETTRTDNKLINIPIFLAWEFFRLIETQSCLLSFYQTCISRGWLVDSIVKDKGGKKSKENQVEEKVKADCENYNTFKFISSLTI